MEINKKFIIIMTLILAVILITFIILKSIPQQVEEPVYFTPEPETWISDNRNSDTPGDVVIDVHKATKALSLIDANKQEYYYYGKRLTLFSHGYYRGNSFTQGYALPEILEESSRLSPASQYEFLEKNTAISISPEMNPSDGIINGFILAKVEGAEVVFYLFVDEDWKKKVEYTNILWSNDLSEKSNANVRKFDFSNSNDGIYVDRIEGLDWFKTGKNGGIFLGEISKDSLDIKFQKDLNATFIYVR